MNVQQPTSKLAGLLMALGQRAQERTLDQLFDALELKEDIPFLTRLSMVDDTLLNCGVEIYPRLQDEPKDNTYLLRRIDGSSPSETLIIERLQNLESASQEFKSTYCYDLKRSVHDPKATKNDLKSDEVRYSALKAIAGLLTTGGGTLFIGVSDEGEVLGLQPDLELLGKNHQSVDSLINSIKNDISHKFLNGNTVNTYVSIDVVSIEEAHILQIEVASRRNLSYLMSKKSSEDSDYKLYRRQDNRTTEVQIYELEEFQEWRNEYLLSAET